VLRGGGGPAVRRQGAVSTVDGRWVASGARGWQAARDGWGGGGWQ
jgi:hypothetical protein